MLQQCSLRLADHRQGLAMLTEHMLVYSFPMNRGNTGSHQVTETDRIMVFLGYCEMLMQH